MLLLLLLMMICCYYSVGGDGDGDCCYLLLCLELCFHPPVPRLFYNAVVCESLFLNVYHSSTAEWHIHPSIHHNSVAPEHDSKGKKVTIYIGWKKSLYFIDGRRLEIILAIFKYWFSNSMCCIMPVQNNCSQNVPAGYIEYILSLCLFCSLGVVGAYVRCIECQVNFWAWILNLPLNACILFP